MMHDKFELYGDGTFGMISIKQKGSGTVPKVLTGSFTTREMAKRAIDRYLILNPVKEKKVKTDGKATSTD